MVIAILYENYSKLYIIYWLYYSSNIPPHEVSESTGKIIWKGVSTGRTQPKDDTISEH